jgi:hypothetical protein
VYVIPVVVGVSDHIRLVSVPEIGLTIRFVGFAGIAIPGRLYFPSRYCPTVVRCAAVSTEL